MAVYLTKSRYLAGLQCSRRLWLTVHQPPEWSEPDIGSPQAMGQEVGRKAHLLFPGGVLVDDPPWAHAEAIAKTAALMQDKSVPAIFEAAFEHDGVRVRVDILERLPRDRWGLREVKASSDVEDYHLDDIAVQAYVLGGAGVSLKSMEQVHINTACKRGKRGISWPKLFNRVDVKDDVAERLPGIETEIAAHMAVLRKRKCPDVDPGTHCNKPFGCDYWDECIADKPDDWIGHLPRLSEKKRTELEALGITSVSAIPADFPLTGQQTTIRQALVSGKPFVAPDLARVLEECGPPAWYLDFETAAPAIPLYAGMRPYQPVPFQWSLHRIEEDGMLSHQEFLADGREDPRREFAETLVAAIGRSKSPIIVYSSFELARLRELAAAFPDLESKLNRIMRRLVDLLPIVRGGLYLPAFDFSFSIKAVAPALCPGFTYYDLPEVANGAVAAAAFIEMADNPQCDEARRHTLRDALLRYCERDTLAMVETHRALNALAGKA